MKPGELPDAVDVLEQYANSRPGELELLMLGSLTNLGRLAIRDPEALSKFKSITFLGTVGGTCEAKANHVVDANVAYDIGAARELHNLVSIDYVPVDVTSTVLFEADDLDRLAAIDSPIANMINQSLGVYVDSYLHRYGRRVIRMHDPSAAAVLAEPQLVDRWRPAVLDLVETEEREKVRGIVTRPHADVPADGVLHPGSAQGRAVSALAVQDLCDELFARYES